MPSSPFVVAKKIIGGVKPETMTDWAATLPTMDLDCLHPIFPELVGLEKDAGRQLVGNQRHVRRTDRSVMLDARRLQNAIEHIGRLPEPREAFHLVTAKQYSLWHVIQAVLHLASPAKIALSRCLHFGIL